MAESAERKDTGGREKKAHHGSQKRQRVKSVTVALMPDERRLMEEKAARAGLSLSSYARACVLGEKGPRAQRRPPVELQQFGKAMAALNKIGGNVNQIAHAVNLGKDLDRIVLARMAEELSIAVNELLQAAGRA